jgi:hypothetical protein
VRDYGGAGLFAFTPAAHLTEQSPMVSPDSARRLMDAWRPHWDSTGRCGGEEPAEPADDAVPGRSLDAHFLMVVRHPVA